MFSSIYYIFVYAFVETIESKMSKNFVYYLLAERKNRKKVLFILIRNQFIVLSIFIRRWHANNYELTKYIIMIYPMFFFSIIFLCEQFLCCSEHFLPMTLLLFYSDNKK